MYDTRFLLLELTYGRTMNSVYQKNIAKKFKKKNWLTTTESDRTCH